MKKQVRARRQRIPAFGEWNYDYGGDWPVTQYFDSAMQAELVPPSPRPVKKVVKWSDSATLESENQQRRHTVVVGLSDHGHGAVKKHSRVADAAAAYKVVKPVDQDLYEIPPDMLCHKPRKTLTRRSVWLGCLGLSCVA